MGRLGFGKALDCLCLTPGSGSCFCVNTLEDEFERKPLMTWNKGEILRLRDVVSGNQTLAFQLKPRLWCQGCPCTATVVQKKVEKHVSKLEGVKSCKIDLQSKMVGVTGDIIPFEVLESVSKVKNAELWNSHWSILLLLLCVHFKINLSCSDSVCKY